MALCGGYVDKQMSGTSLPERYRSLNGLVASSDPLLLSPESLTQWTDKSQADQIYIVKLADRTKNARIITETFKSENMQLVGTALNATWLFEGQTDNDIVNADYFILNVFPFASFHTVCRIVSLFGAHLKNEQLAEDLYTKILPICDKNTSVKLLPKCSVDFIRSIIFRNCFNVPIPQLVRIYNKDVKLVLSYIEKCWKGEGAENMPMSYSPQSNFDEIWTLYAKDYPKEFLILYEKEHERIRVKFGARITRGLIKVGLDKILKKPKLFIHRIHVPTLLNVLKGEELDSFVLSTMAAKEELFDYSDLSIIINHFKQPYRLEYLMKIYAIKYNGASVLDLPSFLNWGMENHISPQLREEWAYKKIEMIQSRDWLKEEHFLKYVSPEKAIPRLMTLCRASSDIDSRISYLEKMIDCCSINGDKDTLLKVLKYTAQRHRNDLDILRYRFLNHVLNSFQLHSLSSEHWEIINEMIEFMIVSREIEKNSRQYFLCSVLEQYLHYLMDNGLPYETVLDRLMEYNVSNINLLIGVQKHEKVLIDLLFERCKVVIDGITDDDKLITMVERLLQSYSKRSDGVKCSPTECDWLMDLITGMLGRKHILDMRIILVCLKRDLKARIMFADKIFEMDSSPATLEYYLKHDAEVITRGIPYLITRCMQTYSLPTYVRFFHTVRAYLANTLGDSLENVIKEQFTSPECEAVGTVALSLILNIEKSEILINKLVPTETKVDLNVHTQEYLNGEFLSRSFMFINPPISYETLEKFSKDDYLKFALPSLLSLSFKKSSEDTLKFIKRLVNKPVSVKKHGIRLAYFQFPRMELLDFFGKLWNSEKNVSIRELIFQRTIRLLHTETNAVKCGEIWETIRHYLESLGELDSGLFHYLGNVRDIRPELLSSYCQACWETLKRLRSQKVQVDNHIVKLSSGFIMCMQHLSVEFCESLITEYMQSMDSESCESQNLLLFLVYYLVNAKTIEQQNAHLQSVCNLFKKNIEENWNKRVKGIFAHRDTVIKFLLKCCSESLNSDLIVDPTNLLKCIFDTLSSQPEGAAFEVRTTIKLCLAYRELIKKPVPNVLHSSNPDSKQLMEEFGSKIGHLLVATCGKLGVEIYPIFYSIFNSFFDMLLEPSDQGSYLILVFISSLIGVKSDMCYVMAVSLLPTRIDSDDLNNYRLYKKLMSQVKNEGNLTIKILMDKKFTFATDELFGNA